MSASSRPTHRTALKRAVVVVAAGRGSRAGSTTPKQYVELAGQPVVQHTLDALAEYDFDAIVFVRPVEGSEHTQLDFSAFRDVAIVPGGRTRTESVREGLRAADAFNIDRVFIHDGARPFVSPQMLARLDVGLDTLDGVVPALPVADALKSLENGELGADLPRDSIVRVQTPQAFSFLPILTAYETVNTPMSDCAAVARMSGMRVGTVEGEDANFKVTYPADFAKAERMLKDPTP